MVSAADRAWLGLAFADAPHAPAMILGIAEQADRQKSRRNVGFEHHGSL